MKNKGINWRKPIIYFLLYLSGSKIPNNLREIQKINNASLENKKKYQKRRLRKILLYAHKNIPYYKKVLEEAGVVKEGKVYLENFDNIPILTKDIIRKEGKNLYSRDRKKRKSYKNTSGGSTGEPVKFLQDKDYNDWNFATKIHYNKVLGKEVGEPELKLWGCDTDIIYNGLDLKERLMNFLYNRKFFNCYRFGEENIRKLIQLHNSFKPNVYWSYMEALVELAKYVKNKKPSFSGLKYVISTIGPLTEENRRLIEKNLNCSVYNQYGSREVSWIAAEKGGELDVFFWNNFVEIDSVNDDEGELLITCLSNYSMPLIRYKIGDAAVKGDNFYEMGNTKSFLSINKVAGRTLGFFKKKDGSLVHSHFFVQQFFFRDWVKRFKIIQKDYDLIECWVEGTKNEKGMQEMEKLFEKLIGKCEIRWKFLNEIKPEKNGKYLYTISEVE